MVFVINQELIDAIHAAWSDETAAGDNDWSATNPAAGHCDVTALVVRESVGGDLRMAQVFRGGELSEYHFWNVLPDGTELDLTESQFDGSETFGEPTLMNEEFFESAGPMNPTLISRLNLFRTRLNSQQKARA